MNTLVIAASFRATDGVLLATVLVLLGFSAVLALAETGLVRTSRARARSLEEHKRHGSRSLRKLIDNPEAFLTPVLLLVLICQIVVATLVGVEAERFFGALGVVIATVLQVVVIFVAVEALPKNWAVRNPDRAALFAAPFVSAVISFPPIRLVATMLIGLSHLITPNKNNVEPEVTESEILALADVAVDEDVIESEERELISSIIDFGDTIVREVMAPRTDIVAVEDTTTAGVVLESAIASGLSRIPVFSDTIDNIVGIAYTKDLMRQVRIGGDNTEVKDLCRPAHFIPETKRVAPLLREMQTEQFHLAVVIDEYGGTAGIVTLEDLIEELIGEITDEFDSDEPLVIPVADNQYEVSGKMAVDEVNELLGVELPTEHADTIGGLLLHLSGHVPVQGESRQIGDISLVADKVQGRRIGAVQILRQNSDRQDAPSS